jgi:transcriptional regulator with XRE-family HTH domain
LSTLRVQVVQDLAELGYSLAVQRVLAEKAEIDWNYVSQVERGERNIALMNLLRMAEALDVNTGELLSDLTTASRPLGS